jgi:hypothetical protein
MVSPCLSGALHEAVVGGWIREDLSDMPLLAREREGKSAYPGVYLAGVVPYRRGLQIPNGRV